jgi:hypothetical protein
MSVFTPKRLFLCVIAVLIGTSAFAKHPSPRSFARMAYDTKNHLGVLFGGHGQEDKATALTHDSNETWLWTGVDWLQQFPATSPAKRSAHTMVYDRNNERVLLFAGLQEPAEVGNLQILFNDLWAWQGNNWTELEGSGTGPSKRAFPGMAWDSDRNVLVVYGGQEFQPLKPKEKTPVLGPIYDTWEYANGTWTQKTSGEPKVVKPLLVYDAINKQVVMMGSDATDAKPAMYRYSNGAWTRLTPAKMPTCANEGAFMVQNNGRYLFLGGLCVTGTPATQEVFEFDGTTWNAVTTNSVVGRGLGHAFAYDTFRDRVVLYGGQTLAGPAPLPYTTVLTGYRSWLAPERELTPTARSWVVFDTDPLAHGLVLFGGLNEVGGTFYNADSWQYSNGEWTGSPGISTSPAACNNPLSTVDTDRNKLVMLCDGNTMWEFDGTEWNDFGELDPAPDERRFAMMTYDPKLKKVVLFGGFFNNNYRNDTWTWDGAKWQELDIDNDDRPEHRGNGVMWYDAAQQKTLIYGGIGRPNLNRKVTRYADMWAFDGTRWTKLENVTTPGIRFRPQVRVNPTNGKLFLFGGLRAENVDEDSIRQFFDNDTWEWDGATSKWTELHPEHRPAPRQNGGLAWDPTTNEMVLFGGYANGFYHSDVWIWNGSDWRPVPDTFNGPRRRSAR